MTTIALESKWVTAGWRPEARAIEARYSGGIVATWDILDLQHKVWAARVPVVALLLA